MMGKRRSDWEQLYDFKTQSYFYRDKVSDSFSRTLPLGMPAIDNAPVSRLPIWVFKIDFRSNSREVYWDDLETGYITFLRPEVGTFVDEQPLSDFRKFNASAYQRQAAAKAARAAPPPPPPSQPVMMAASNSHNASRKSMTSAKSVRLLRPKSIAANAIPIPEEPQLLDTERLKSVRPDDDFAIVSGYQQEVNFAELFEEANPDNFDANARMEAAAAAINGIAPRAAPKQIRLRRLNTRDGAETPQFPVLDEVVMERKSVYYSDNPLFNPALAAEQAAPAAATKRTSRWKL